MNHPVRNLTKSQRAASAQRFFRLFVRCQMAYNALHDLRTMVELSSEVEPGDLEAVKRAMNLIRPIKERYKSRWNYENDTFRDTQ